MPHRYMTDIKLLNCGHVQLIDIMGDDVMVCNSARVSFDKSAEWDNTGSEKVLPEKDEKLIKYLATHNHWTPFAHPQITLRIKAPISIRTQFFKHKQGFVENEISRRYVSFEPEFYYPEWRGKPEGGAKQGSDDFIELDKETSKGYESAVRLCLYTYNQLLENGVAPEQARFVLPQAMYTEWYWTGSLAAYARFYKQRIDSHAQWEIRQYAKAVGEIIRPHFPVSWKYLSGEKD
jgi:thymidylate synthase (FAD)